jgi:S-adenosylmethionine synthetase
LAKVNQPEYLINPSGSFTKGGPHGDTGLTGHKIVVDTYGGRCPHGGGTFSGKDPSKVNRSAAYAARYIAKHLVAANLMEKCAVQLSYAIVVIEPTSIHIESYGTHRCDLTKIVEVIYDLFPVRPNQMIDDFELRKPMYAKTASYGHFGKEFPWEKLDEAKVKALEMLFTIR